MEPLVALVVAVVLQQGVLETLLQQLHRKVIVVELEMATMAVVVAGLAQTAKPGLRASEEATVEAEHHLPFLEHQPIMQAAAAVGLEVVME
jgi:hypothetical protein